MPKFTAICGNLLSNTVILYGGFPQTSRMKQELKKYTRPSLLVLDELGFLPIDTARADLLFQVISQRYEQGAMVITSNKAFNDCWPEIFNNDSTLTSAILIDCCTILKLLNSRE